MAYNKPGRLPYSTGSLFIFEEVGRDDRILVDKPYSVYIHINKTNNKKYVGITSDIKSRWGCDGRGYLHNMNHPFSKAIKKYGWDGFEHIVLHTGLSKDAACDLERYYIAEYKTNVRKYGSQFGYNLTDGGDGFTGGYNRSGCNGTFYGKHHSVESKCLISESRSGKASGVLNGRYGKITPAETKDKIKASLNQWHENNDCSNRKRVYCITDEEWYDSLKDAATHYGISPSLISACCLGYALSTHGKQFTYSENMELPEFKHTYGARKKARGDDVKGIPNAKRVLCVETGKEFPSLRSAADEVGLKYPNGIRKCCTNERGMSGGYHWRFID